MNRSRTPTIVTAAVALVLLLAASATMCAGCWSTNEPESSSATSGTGASGLPPMARFELVSAPLESQMAFTADAVVWRVPPENVDPMGPWPDVDVTSFDIAAGTTSRDEWLTAMLTARAVQDWMLAGDRVAWIDGSKRRSVEGGETVRIGTRVLTAVRGDDRPKTIWPLAWGAVDTSGGYKPAVWGLDGDVTLITWCDERIRLSEDAAAGDVRLWVWDATSGRRHRLADRIEEESRLTVGGRRVFTVVPPNPASSTYPTTTIHAWDAATDTRSTVRQDDFAISPAAADEKTLVWTVVPPMTAVAQGMTDFVDADLAGCDLASGKVFTISREPGGQTDPAVDGDLVVWVDTPLGSNSPLPDGSRPLSTLRGIQLSKLDSGVESILVEDPFRDEASDSPLNDVTLIGDRLFWTIMREGTCTAYGARVVAGSGGLTLEPLRD